MRYPALFPASDLVNHWAASADSLWLTPTSFSLITVGGRPLCLFIHPTTIENAVEFYSSFDINSILELCCCCRAGLSLPGATNDACSIPQQGYTAEEPSPRSPLVSSPLLPSLSRPITNSLLRYNDIEFWQLRVFSSFFFFSLLLNFFSTPPSSSFFHSLSLCLFLRSLISAQRQVGRFSRTLNESLWNCSCLFDLRFSLLKSGPRYQQRDVTSARARSNAARSECSLACTHQPKSY